MSNIIKNWQLYKRNLITNVITKAYKQWEPMTEKEAKNTEKAQSLSIIYHFFASKITSEWENENN